MMRQPTVSGAFYPASPRELSNQIMNYMPETKDRRHVKGVIAPHAGYAYSGPVAAMAYSKIKPADTYIILGPNHYGVGGDFSIMLEGSWSTPLGEARIDDILAKNIFKNSRLLSDDIKAHEREHSIEVQIPFIQTIGENPYFIPISIKHYPATEGFHEKCCSLANELVEAVKAIDGSVTFIASTDFTHYESRESAGRKDEAAIKKILELDSKGLFQEITRLDISMCGYAPVAVVVEACKLLGAGNIDLTGYQTSGDVTGDHSQVVGYAGFLID